jgi:hypothetical protein
LLLFGIRRVVGHQHAVLVPCPVEHLGHFLGGADTSPGLGGLLGQLEGQAEEVGTRRALLGYRLVRWRTVANVDSMGLVVRKGLGPSTKRQNYLLPAA